MNLVNKGKLRNIEEDISTLKMVGVTATNTTSRTITQNKLAEEGIFCNLIWVGNKQFLVAQTHNWRNK